MGDKGVQAGSEYERVSACVAAVRERAKGRSPAVGVILGSGLGPLADLLQNPVTVPYEELPHFPRSTVVGHAGRLVLGELGGVQVVAMQGRAHFYEGYTPAQVAFPARVLCGLGIRVLTVTNAAGAINTAFRAGDLMAIVDHINMAGFNPLVGPNDERFGVRFPDLTRAYEPRLTALLNEVAAREGVELRRGVYAMMSGPSYETPAEIRALRVLGADAVGMSTVPEVVAAAHMGVKVVGVSCLTNLAAGLGDAPLTHEEVAETAERVRGAFTRLLVAFLPEAARGAA